MTETTKSGRSIALPKNRLLRWFGVVTAITLVFGIHYFRKLYDMPDQLGTIFYNAYLGSEEGLPDALQELNSFSTYYEEAGQETRLKETLTGYRFSVEGRALVVTNRSLNSWVAGRIISRVITGAQLRTDSGPRATEALRRKSWQQTSAELRRLGLNRLIFRNDDGDGWEVELP
jgi:hypothetical protein